MQSIIFEIFSKLQNTSFKTYELDMLINYPDDRAGPSGYRGFSGDATNEEILQAMLNFITDINKDFDQKLKLLKQYGTR